MSEKIEPALSAEDWKVFGGRPPRPNEDDEIMFVGKRIGPGLGLGALTVRPSSELHAVIALANAALPDSDPRKITREWLTDLRVAASNARGLAAKCDDKDDIRILHERARQLEQRADALESYLPPEE